MPFLEIRELSYTYPNSGVCAVDGLNLDADKGEMLAIVGPNAAGKSTLALLLKGLLNPDCGKIMVNGTHRSGAGPDQGVGILFSNPENQLVTSIVEEDIAFGLEVLCEPPRVIKQKVENVLAGLGIEHLRRRMPHLMSGGEQQIAALAGILVLDPDILILDEPTAYLDPDARKYVMTAVRNLRDQGKVILWITHDMREAAQADRVLLLDAGSITLDAAPEEFFNRAGLEERYDIRPPFLLSLTMEMQTLGLDLKWPPEENSLVRALAGCFERAESGGPEKVVSRGSDNGSGGILAYDAIHFKYGGDLPGEGDILKGVDFSVRKGSFALVCGANGSGKSTLLQMSNGIIIPDRGTVLLDGRPLKEWKKKRGRVPGRVALLFQNPERQVFSATVFDDIAFGPRNLGMETGKVEERVRKAVGWVGLPDGVLDRPVHTLSGGQMRRVAVAGVLAMEPEILVLDEPTDGLDPAGAREFFNSARRFCDETGTAILIATHEVPEQIACIDHFGHLAEGRMRSSGPPSETLTGQARTLPVQFLPDHVALGEKLAEAGVPFPVSTLDPEVALEKLLILAEKKNLGQEG